MEPSETFADLGGLELMCPDSVPLVLGLLDPSIAPPFLYYSYIPIIVISLSFGLFVFLVSRSLSGRLLLWVAVVFSLIIGSELFLWIAAPAALVHFVWQIINILHGLLAFLLVYFTYAFLTNDHMPARWQWGMVALLLPVFVLAPTSFNASAFDLVNCEGVQGPLSSYLYALETLALAAAFFILVRVRRRSQDRGEKRKTLILGASMVVFFGIYILSNVFGDVTLIYDINLVGPLGMVGFLATVAYLIVRYHAFNLRVFGAQALVAALVALIFAALFAGADVTRYVLIATLVLTVFLGILLVRAVKREIEQREHIELLAEELKDTNERQEGLLHFIGHEVKGYLAKDEGAFAALLDGDVAPLPEPLRHFVSAALAQSRDGAKSVTDILTASNQKKGTLSYDRAPFDLAALAAEVVEKEKPMADGKRLALSFEADAAGAPYTIGGDQAKVGDNVLRNLIENAIHYTPAGSVRVSLAKKDGKIVFGVQDTGIGISQEDKKRLFTEGGHGKDSIRVNVHSTGYGLFIAKNVVEAHGGSIRAESEGPGKGSRFVVEFPSAA